MLRQERKTKKSDRCQKKLSLNQCNFLPSCLWLSFTFHYSVKKKIPVVMAYTKSQQACSLYEKGRVVSFEQRASAHVFLRSRHKPKNLAQFLHFRKYFYNFKYNNFLFGVRPNITHTCIWLSYICFFFFFFFF